MDSMQDTDDTKTSSINTSVLFLCFSISIFISSLFYLSYHLSNTNKGSIAIPAGKTYLGPPANNPSWVNFSQPEKTEEKEAEQTVFTADAKTKWIIWEGKTYAYRFSYPETLPLSGFPNDPNDSVGISWNGKKPAENILINVIDLSKNTTFVPYAKKPKKEFVSNWWKQFSGLTGVSPIAEFTNKKGLKGYKARFINTEGETPNLDVFFEVPNDPTRMIRIANGILDETVFDTIVESVEWKTDNTINPINPTNK